MGVYYNGPKKKENVKPLTVTLVIVVVLMVTFFFVVPSLFGERCNWLDTDPVYIPQGIGQVVGPTGTITCYPPLIILPEKIGSIIFVIWFLLPIVSLLTIIIGVIVQLKTE